MAITLRSMELVTEKIEESQFPGYYVAAYASSSLLVERGSLGYFKVFTQPVRSYFSPAACLAKGVSAMPTATVFEAVDLALAAGNEHLADLLAACGRLHVEEDGWVVLCNSVRSREL